MRAKSPQDKSDLTLRSVFLDASPRLGEAHDDLMRRVFGSGVEAISKASKSIVPVPRWVTLGFFDREGSCVAALDTCRLQLMADGDAGAIGAIGRVAVDECWRGLGLFRVLMERALHRSDARAADPILLYTEGPSLYGRFGFHSLVQHSFAGPPPAPIRVEAAVPVDATEKDRIRWMLTRRAPVSRQCAIRGADDLFLAHLAQADDLRLDHAAELDALIVTEAADDELVVVDVVAPEIPSMAAILGALGAHPRRVRTLFPPDLLSWHGDPEEDDTGLMACGALPEALRRPFMLPPTTEF